MGELNVVAINGGPIPELGLPNEAVIKLLESLVERAKSGEVVGIAIALMHSDRCASWRVAGIVGSYSMIGALRSAEHELLSGTDDP